jgi:hypothetical protein
MSDKPDAPQDVNFDGDISQLDSLGIHAFEIFSSLKIGGFSHQDALTLVGHLISSGFMEVATYKYNSTEAELELDDEDYLGPDDLDE